MPAYLAHGFRWHRSSIIIFCGIHDLDNAASGWIIGRQTSEAIIGELYSLYEHLPTYTPRDRPSSTPPKPSLPEKSLSLNADTEPPSPTIAPGGDEPDTLSDYSAIHLLEQYDANDESKSFSDYAFVADHVVRVDLSCDIGKEMEKFEEIVAQRGGHDWFVHLRNELQVGEEIRWYVVHCADTEREWPDEPKTSLEETTLREESEERQKRECEVQNARKRSQAPQDVRADTDGAQEASGQLRGAKQDTPNEAQDPLEPQAQTQPHRKFKLPFRSRPSDVAAEAEGKGKGKATDVHGDEKAPESRSSLGGLASTLRGLKKKKSRVSVGQSTDDA